MNRIAMRVGRGGALIVRRQLTAWVPERLARQAKGQACKEGRTMTELVAQAVEEYLAARRRGR